MIITSQDIQIKTLNQWIDRFRTHCHVLNASCHVLEASTTLPIITYNHLQSIAESKPNSKVSQKKDPYKKTHNINVIWNEFSHGMIIIPTFLNWKRITKQFMQSTYRFRNEFALAQTCLTIEFL